MAAEDWLSTAAAEVRERARAVAVERAVEHLAGELTEQLVAAARSRPERPVPRSQGTVLWCYGVTSGIVPAVAGIDGAAVRGVRIGGLTALISALPAARFDAGALEAELEDLDRLAAIARAHEAVLAAALEDGPVVPFRLCAVYSDEAAVLTAFEARRDVLGEALRRVTGMAEWSVKVLHRPPAVPAEPVVADTGADYLAGKRAAREQATAGVDAALAVAGRVHEGLCELAADAVLSRAQDRRLSEHEGEMVLNAAYLVPDDGAEAFRARVEELAERYEAEDMHFQLAGPWPAHHFSATEAA